MKPIHIATGQFSGIGTTAELITHARTQSLADAQLERALSIARQRVDELDKAASRFRTDSELTVIQAVHTGDWTSASSTLTRALHAALWASEWTGGLIDPTIGHALRSVGYDRDIAAVQSGAAHRMAAASHQSSWRDLGVRLNQNLIRIPRGTQIDLGATGKSWLAVMLAAEIHGVTGGGILVNLGGDIAVDGPAPAGGWTVSIDDGREGDLVAIEHGAIATSSTRRRAWDVNAAGANLRKHHIIDPRTGDSARVIWDTVTVIADSCLTANSAATASIILGDEALPWLAERRLHARLVSTSDEVVYVGEWPGALSARGVAS